MLGPRVRLHRRATVGFWRSGRARCQTPGKLCPQAGANSEAVRAGETTACSTDCDSDHLSAGEHRCGGKSYSKTSSVSLQGKAGCVFHVMYIGPGQPNQSHSKPSCYSNHFGGAGCLRMLPKFSSSCTPSHSRSSSSGSWGAKDSLIVRGAMKVARSVQDSRSCSRYHPAKC